MSLITSVKHNNYNLDYILYDRRYSQIELNEALQAAVNDGNIEAVEKIVRREPNRIYYRILNEGVIESLRRGDRRMAKFLLSYNRVNPNVASNRRSIDTDGRIYPGGSIPLNPLNYAILNNDWEMIQLVRTHPKFDPIFLDWPIEYALKLNDINLANFLITGYVAPRVIFENAPPTFGLESILDW